MIGIADAKLLNLGMVFCGNGVIPPFYFSGISISQAWAE